MKLTVLVLLWSCQALGIRGLLFGPPRKSSLPAQKATLLAINKAQTLISSQDDKAFAGVSRLSRRRRRIIRSPLSSLQSSSSSSVEGSAETGNVLSGVTRKNGENQNMPVSQANNDNDDEDDAGIVVEEEESRRQSSSSSLRGWQSVLTRMGMVTYIVAMCLALPLTLLPQRLIYRLGYLSRVEKEHCALATGQFCARWLLRLIPFCRITTFPHHHPNPPESIWVCNHTSMLDVFILLAADRQLRGRTKRPIKIVYWKDLERNPVTRLLFRQSGFIPVKMADNGHGRDNDYDKSSFKQLVKDSKQAFADGFDIGVLPEGQLNPSPEKGLLPVFAGAFSLARMSRRPMQMLSLKGVHDLWHPVHGMHCVGRHVQIRAYPYMFRFGSSADFIQTFTAMVGHFALHGSDLEEQEQNNLVANNLVLATKK